MATNFGLATLYNVFVFGNMSLSNTDDCVIISQNPYHVLTSPKEDSIFAKTSITAILDKLNEFE